MKGLRPISFFIALLFIIPATAVGVTDPLEPAANQPLENGLLAIGNGLRTPVAESGVDFIAEGILFPSTPITLRAGWNLVGYPTLTQRSVAAALAGTGYTAVEGFDGGDPYRLRPLADSYIMKPGEGYWVHVPADTVWIIDW